MIQDRILQRHAYRMLASLITAAAAIAFVMLAWSFITWEAPYIGEDGPFFFRYWLFLSAILFAAFSMRDEI